MALGTLGTNATTSLNFIKAGFSGTGTGQQSYPNIGVFNNAIRDDQIANHPQIRNQTLYGFDGQVTGIQTGGCLLHVPNRGVLRVLAGDYVAYDTTTGWPILVSARAINAGPWTHSP